LTIEETFTLFIEDFQDDLGEIKYENAISELFTLDLKSLIIEFKDLYTFNADFATELLLHPETHLSFFEMVVRSKLRMRYPKYAEMIERINVRIKGLPETTPLRSIGSKHIGKLIRVKGIIVRTAPVHPLTVTAIFRCSTCGEVNKIEQSGQTLMKPQKCISCDNRKGFELVPGESGFIDSQSINIQERPEDSPPGHIPRSLRVELLHDLVDTVRPGDRVILTGVITILQRFGRGGELRKSDVQVNASYIDVSGRDVDFFDLSPEEEEKMRAIAADPFVHQNLLNSIAPSIYGYDHIKQAVLYLLLGGIPREREDVRIRGDINVLLVGDPGTAKSQMLNYVAKVAPKGILTTGSGSSAAGLTAAVVKEGGTGSYVLEAGALVLADKGVCCIDEMDKMREEDRNAIHPAMEQQIVPIAKGGIVATLNARCSILAAANPILGRYNPYQNIGQNIALPVTLLSRFDLIFVLRDIPDNQLDSEIALHILNLARDQTLLTPPLDMATMKKYISFAKTINPVLTQEVIDRFHDYYVQMRDASVEGGEASAISITARQLEALIRLSEARARAHLRETITLEDAEAVINLTQKSLEQVGIDMATGKIDIDILYTGKPRSLQNQLQKVLQIITEMERHGAVKESDLYDTLEGDYGINRNEVTRFISMLMKDGTIYAPRPGYFRRTS